MINFQRKSKDALIAIGGTSLKVYIYLLARNDEVGIRELQKALGFKSPSTAKHHLDRLVELGLAEKTTDGYKAVSSSKLLQVTLLTFLNRLLPIDMFFGMYGLLSVFVYLLFFFRDIDAKISVLLLVVSVISCFLVYRGITLYGWYRDILSTRSKERDDE